MTVYQTYLSHLEERHNRQLIADKRVQAEKLAYQNGAGSVISLKSIGIYLSDKAFKEYDMYTHNEKINMKLGWRSNLLKGELFNGFTY